MITERDLLEAIAECEGKRNPNADTCIKLASYYTILGHMRNKENNPPAAEQVGYSFESKLDSGTEFSNTIRSMEINDVLVVMDELMGALQVVNPRLYNSVIRKLKLDYSH